MSDTDQTTDPPTDQPATFAGFMRQLAGERAAQRRTTAQRWNHRLFGTPAPATDTNDTEGPDAA